MSKAGISNACACAGVLLLIVSAVAPEDWYPAAALFAGLTCLMVSHALMPCLDRLAVWRKQLLK